MVVVHLQDVVAVDGDALHAIAFRADGQVLYQKLLAHGVLRP